jgi:NitT/TauT family transport system substrate-binding protein
MELPAKHEISLHNIPICYLIPKNQGSFLKGIIKMRNIKSRLFVLLTIVLAGLFSAVTPSDTYAKKEENVLKIALLPIIDAFPLYVAEEEGLFAKEGVNVKAIPVASGLERDQLMQAGEIHGMLNEMTTTAAFNRNKVQVKIIGICRASEEGSPLFRILAAPGGNVKSAEDLANIPIGVSKGTIIEYVTDRLLTGKGLKQSLIITKSVPSIPERYQLLMQGQLKAVTLPDPIGKSALDAGAVEVINDTLNKKLSVSVLSFSTAAIAENREAVILFMKAWNRAAANINKDPEAYRELLLKKIGIPGNVQSTYIIPPFSVNQVPDAGQWDDVMKWMIEKGLLETALPYEESVSTMFLP